MKILLNAYACEPNRGSEPGVGWHWAIELSKDKNKEVHVLTRANNKEVIDEFWSHQNKPANLYFHYYDLPAVWIWAKHHGFPVNIYYSMWLFGAGRYAKSLNDRICFDMAHHITFGVFRDAPFLCGLKIPYSIGPVGGGEYTPKSLMCLYGTFKGRMAEYVRMFVNKAALLNPFYYLSYNKASLILTKTDETKDALGYTSFKKKAVTSLEIGIDKTNADNSIKRDKHVFLYVGRFISWKGIELTLLSFKDYHDRFDNDAHLMLIGKGYMKAKIEQFAVEYNLTDKIKIIDWIEQKNLLYYYQSCGVMLFPSLHDSSGNVVLEAMSCGMPVVSLDCGGPAVVLGKNLKSLVVDVNDRSVSQVASAISERLNTLVSDGDTYQLISGKCVARASELLWSETVSNTYHLVEKRLFGK